MEMRMKSERVRMVARLQKLSKTLDRKCILLTESSDLGIWTPDIWQPHESSHSRGMYSSLQ